MSATGAVLRKYTYIDKDKKAAAVATEFVAKLAMRYPTQLSQEAIQGFNKLCPQHMEEIGPNELENLVVRHGGIDIVCGGFNCQSLSQAGQKKGAEDMRFGSFYHLVSMLNWCQNKQQGRKVVWVCENT